MPKASGEKPLGIPYILVGNGREIRRLVESADSALPISRLNHGVHRLEEYRTRAFRKLPDERAVDRRRALVVGAQPVTVRGQKPCKPRLLRIAFELRELREVRSSQAVFGRPALRARIRGPRENFEGVAPVSGTGEFGREAPRKLFRAPGVAPLHKNFRLFEQDFVADFRGAVFQNVVYQRVEILLLNLGIFAQQGYRVLGDTGRRGFFEDIAEYRKLSRGIAGY